MNGSSSPPARAQVSLLLPCLNAREFLEARIESLLNQTFSDWEAIVLDSNSSDGSWEFFQSIAATDSRFQLHQVPREGLYAALNRGLAFANGEFFHVATCDDTMMPGFLGAMLQALKNCPEAGIAACDLQLINREGNDLSLEEVLRFLPANASNELLRGGDVRDIFEQEPRRQMNFRPAPHDCLLHFSGKSVYFSLTQLVIRTAVAKKAGPFDTNVGSIADFGWLLRLTNLTGTVHLPEKLATWRFHGDQLSIQSDESRLSALLQMCETAIPEIYQRHYPRLSRNVCAMLLLPCRRHIAKSFVTRLPIWVEAGLRSVWMFCRHPIATFRALRQRRFRIPTVRDSLVPIVVQTVGCLPKKIEGFSRLVAKEPPAQTT